MLDTGIIHLMALALSSSRIGYISMYVLSPDSYQSGFWQEDRSPRQSRRSIASAEIGFTPKAAISDLRNGVALS